MHDAAAIADAEACFRAALNVARAQEARWWELRTSVSLARLLLDTNRRDEARAMLTEIYNWFTEGFDTPDLKDAKALLDELATYTRVGSMRCLKCSAPFCALKCVFCSVVPQHPQMGKARFS
jgi:predicted ATPase